MLEGALSFPKLATDVPTLDFSGWPVYTYKHTAGTLWWIFAGRWKRAKIESLGCMTLSYPSHKWCVTLRKAISKSH
jgi:hypothetical protein